jgi:dephospho-CoA kinase
VGLTGGLATGKSFVARIFAELGAYVLKADELGHRLLRRGETAYELVVALFGPGILDGDQQIDRKKLGALVFEDPEALKKLNSIIHPAVFAYEKLWLDEIESRDPRAIAVVEAAILIETGNYKSFDCLVVTWCPEHLQMERALTRGQATEAEVRRRLARQLPADEKLKFANFVIDTSGSLAETEARARATFGKLVTLEQEAQHL